RRARDHAGVDQVVDPRAPPDDLRARLLHGAGGGAGGGDVRVAGGAPGAHRRARGADEAGGQATRLRAGGRAPGPAQGLAQASARVVRAAAAGGASLLVVIGGSASRRRGEPMMLVMRAP